MKNFLKIIQYSLACFCVYVIFIWNGVKPPDINFDDVRELQGVYMCYVSGGKSPSGDERINGVSYVSGFGYVFGVKGPNSCYRQINGNIVFIKYLEAGDQRILLEVVNSVDKKIYGNSVGKSIKLVKHELSDKSSIGWVKFLSFIVLVCLVAWGHVKQFFSKICKLSKLGE